MARRGFTVKKGGLAHKQKADNYFDYTLVFIVLFLLGFGLIMIYSTSSYEAGRLYNDAAFYLKRQGIASILGIAAMIGVSNIPYKFWEQFALPAYIVSIALVWLVLTPLGVEVNGARRWIALGFGFNIQPAEVAKLGMILFLAGLVTGIGKNINQKNSIAVILLSQLPICLSVYSITNNLSSTLIIFGIAVLMLFVASPKYMYFIIAAAVILLGAGLLVLIIYKTGQGEGAVVGGFRSERILAWISPEAYASGKGFQTLQSLYAIGSGGVFGKGLGQSMQKLGFIPEAQNDMIFSIICEELGLFGALAIIMLFVLLLWRFLIIANNAPDMYGGLIVVGVMGHIAIQVILNISVVTNTMPNTGITLPFISYGGSSVLFLLIEIGMVLSVSREIKLAKV